MDAKSLKSLICYRINEILSNVEKLLKSINHMPQHLLSYRIVSDWRTIAEDSLGLSIIET